MCLRRPWNALDHLLIAIGIVLPTPFAACYKKGSLELHYYAAQDGVRSENRFRDPTYGAGCGNTAQRYSHGTELDPSPRHNHQAPASSQTVQQCLLQLQHRGEAELLLHEAAGSVAYHIREMYLL